MRRKFIEILLKLLDTEPKFLLTLTPQQKQDYWATLWENGAFRNYIESRDTQLRHYISESVINGKAGNAWIFAGQCVENKILREKAHQAFEAKRSFAKVKKPS